MEAIALSPRVHSLLNRLPALRSLGLAVEYFPCYRNFQLRPHALDVVLLSYIVRGTGRHHMGTHAYEARAGSLGITHYGQVHDILTGPEGMEIYNIYLDLKRHGLPSLPAEFMTILPEILPLHPYFQNHLNRRIQITFADSRWPTTILAHMVAEQQGEALGFQEVMRSCFRLFLIECCRAALATGIRPSLESTDLSAWPRVEKIRRYIDENYRQPQTLTALARRAGLSAAHLCRSFKRYTGKRLFDYLLQRRIQAAMLALRSTNDKVLAIVLDCGFNDPSYFNRRFRAIVGCTPLQYRRGNPQQPPS